MTEKIDELARYNISCYENRMILGLKLRKVGNAPCAVLPVKRTKAEVTQQLKAAQDIIRRYRNTLRELAK